MDETLDSQPDVVLKSIRQYSRKVSEIIDEMVKASRRQRESLTEITCVLEPQDFRVEAQPAAQAGQLENQTLALQQLVTDLRAAREKGKVSSY